MVHLTLLRVLSKEYSCKSVDDEVIIGIGGEEIDQPSISLSLHKVDFNQNRFKLIKHDSFDKLRVTFNSLHLSQFSITIDPHYKQYEDPIKYSFYYQLDKGT